MDITSNGVADELHRLSHNRRASGRTHRMLERVCDWLSVNQSTRAVIVTRPGTMSYIESMLRRMCDSVVVANRVRFTTLDNVREETRGTCQSTMRVFYDHAAVEHRLEQISAEVKRLLDEATQLSVDVIS